MRIKKQYKGNYIIDVISIISILVTMVVGALLVDRYSLQNTPVVLIIIGIIGAMLFIWILAYLKRKQIPNQIEYIDTLHNLTLEADDLYVYCDNYDEMIMKLEKLSETKYFLSKEDKVAIAADIQEAKNDEQWHMRDTINRMADNAIDEIQGKYKNSYEHQKKTYHAFCDTLLKWEDRYKMEETLQMVEYSKRRVQAAMQKPSFFMESTNEDTSRQVSLNLISDQNSSQVSTDPSLAIIDQMRGIDFEYFCANLLTKSGFESVEVTKTSNDFGGDVLAQRDGVKYVIQCKRYNSNVGVSAVQEVLGSMSIYNCHVGVVLTNNYFTQQALTLAKNNNILCWDRDELARRIKQYIMIEKSFSVRK